MQKNDKSYTFLLSHSKKSSIYIKRVEVQRSYLRHGLFGAGIFTILSFVSLGVYAVANYSGFQTLQASAHSAENFQTQLSSEAKPSSFDYSRPGDSGDDFTANSGGPFDQNDGESDQED